MSLFPAYAGDSPPKENLIWSKDIGKNAEWDMAISAPVSPGSELRLLQSDSDDETSDRVPPPKRPRTPVLEQDFYVDKKMDRGNLRVSTLYYPGRPEYRERAPHRALGSATHGGRRTRLVRYFATPAPPTDDVGDAAERTAALQRHLAASPRDLRAWLNLIQLQEQHAGPGAALAAAAAAGARWPRCGALLATRARLLPHAAPPPAAHAQLTALLDQQTGPDCAGARRLLRRALALLAAREGDGALQAALLRAQDPDLLPVYAWYLRGAGHWERLTQLVELAAALYYPRSAHFPPAAAEPGRAERERAEQERLDDYEDQVIHSGLPLTAVWARVERARAAAHWRPAAGSAAAGAADEERCPRASETAALLPPAPPPPHALLDMLQISLFGLYAVEAELPPAPLEQLLEMLDAAADVGAAAAVGAAALLREYADPPTCLASDDYGFGAWLEGLWLALAGWGARRQRTAAAARGLRWLRAVAAAGGAVAARAAGRRLLRAAPRCAVLAVEFSRLEARVAELLGEPLTRAARVARSAAAAAAAALREPPGAPAEAGDPPGAPADQDLTEQALYVARRAWEVLRAAGGADGAREGRALLLRVASEAQIVERSEEIERALAAECDAALETPPAAREHDAALLPGEAEWGVARELLRPRAARALHEMWALGGPRARRYGGTLARAAAPRVAAALAPLYPHDARLQLVAAREPAWRGAGLCAGPPSATQQLARALPQLLRAPRDADARSRAARLLARGAGGELAARAALAAGARLEPVLDDAPHCKWLYVSAAAAGGDVSALQALMLERQLRVRALLQELRPVRPVGPGVVRPASPASPARG